MPNTPLGPWPLGQDTFHSDPYHAVFQPQEKLPARLMRAMNCTLDDAGKPHLRPGAALAGALVAGLSGCAFTGGILVQDGDSLILNPQGARQTLASGLATARISFHEHLGSVYWSNGINRGLVRDNGTLTNWGLDVAPTPDCSVVSGAMAAGDYLVALSFVDGNGVESAADLAALITVGTDQGISVTQPSVPTDVTEVRVWCTEANGETLYSAGSALPSGFPFAISDITDEPLRTQFFTPPILGDVLFTYHGFLMIGDGQFLFPSSGVNTHLFDPTEAEARPANIHGGAGLEAGFWTVCERGAYWTTGDEPAKWRTVRKDGRAYAKGGTVVPGSLFPQLETGSEIALFVSENGLVAGMPDGSLYPITKDRWEPDVTGKRYDFAVLDHRLYLNEV